MVEWRPLLVGLFFSIAVFVVSYLAAQTSGFLAVLLGTVVLGYMLIELKAGAIHGAILGLIMGVIVALFQIITYTLMGLGAIVMAALGAILVLIILEIVIGAVGGIIGSLIRTESLVEVEEE